MTTLRKSRPLAALAAAALAAAIEAGVTHAGSMICTSEIHGGTYGNIVVPAGAACGLQGVTVQGNIEIQSRGRCILLDSIVNGNVATRPGGSLAIEDTIVRGNVSGTDPQVVQLQLGTKVYGNVSIVGATGVSVGDIIPAGLCGALVTGNVEIADSSQSVAFGGPHCSGQGNIVGGNVSIEDNDTFLVFDVGNNTVGKNMSIDGNIGTAAKNISNNAVTGNLNCSDNEAPLTVSGNAARKLNGQCKP